MALVAGRRYLIRNRCTRSYMHVKGSSMAVSALIDQDMLYKVNDDNRKSEVWHLMPVDRGYYILANYRSGLVLNVAGNSDVMGAELEQYYMQIDGVDAPQIWSICEPLEDDYHLLRNAITGFYAFVESHSYHSGRNLCQWDLETDRHFLCQQWAFQVEYEYPQILVANRGVLGDASDFGDIARLTGFGPPASNTTEEVLVGLVVFPFPLVQERMGRAEQSVKSPYYFIHRYSFWKNVLYRMHKGVSDHDECEMVVAGLTSNIADEIMEATHISVNYDSTFSFLGFSARMSQTFERQLKVFVRETVTEDCSSTAVVMRSYQAGKRLSEAVWYRGDHYVMSRLDGTLLVEWTTLNSAYERIDSYPSK